MPRRRALPMPKGWDRIRTRILRRDGHRCQWPTDDPDTGPSTCGEPAREVDHKQGAALLGYDDHSDANLWALCTHHHAAKTAREASAIAHALPPRDRPREPHPGLITPT